MYDDNALIIYHKPKDFFLMIYEFCVQSDYSQCEKKETKEVTVINLFSM